MLTPMNSESLTTRVHQMQRLPPAIMGRWMVGTICWISRSLWFRLGSQPGCRRSQMDTCQEVVEWPLLLTNFQGPSSNARSDFVDTYCRWFVDVCCMSGSISLSTTMHIHLGSGFKTRAHSCREAGCLRMFANAKKSCLLCSSHSSLGMNQQGFLWDLNPRSWCGRWFARALVLG